MSDLGGVWRTVGGRRIFIKDGEDLATAMKKSGKFNTKSIEKNKKNVIIENEKKGKEIKEKLNKFKDEKIEDGTYNIETGEKVDFNEKGYNVSFEQSSDNYTSSEYYEKVEECRKMCDGNIYAGKFGGDPEISFYTNDIKVAKKIMYKYNQHSIWSNELNDIIKNEKYDINKNKTGYKE